MFFSSFSVIKFHQKHHFDESIACIYDVSLIVLSQDSEDTLDLRIGNVDQDFDTQRNILTLHNVANTVMKNPAMISKNLYESLRWQENIIGWIFLLGL